MIHLTSVQHIADHTIRVEFDDGSVKDVDLSGELWGEVFEPLRDVDYFRQGRFNPETRTIEWPNGADLAPEFLYEKGERVERFG